jgi:hypothetical protein
VGGPFDSFAPKLAKTLVGVFVPGPKAWTREVAGNYDPTSGADPVVTTNGSFQTGVPVPYMTKPVNGTSVLTGDLAIFVPALNVTESGFDPFPEDDATVNVTIDGLVYKVISFITYKSGDNTAGYEFQIRR